MHVAVVHDKLMQFGGAERVVLTLLQAWPQAELYTSAYDPELVAVHGFGAVHATVLQRTPLLQRAHHLFLPLYHPAFRMLRLDGFDAVVSSSAQFAKSVRPPRGVPHLCYCHTPPRMLWDLGPEGLKEINRPRAVREVARAAVPMLRRLDRSAADHVDVFIANSTHVQERIRRYYDRESVVINPPVEVARYDVEADRGDHALVMARLYPYKRVDLAIEACRLAGVPLKIMGDGPDEARLREIARGADVEFLGWVAESEKPRLVAEARLVLAPQIEDFGIAMAEAIAAGTPVVALRDGGAVDIVQEGVTGAFFERQEAEAIARVLRRHDDAAYDRATLRAHAAKWAPEAFVAAMEEQVRQAITH